MITKINMPITEMEARKERSTEEGMGRRGVS